MISIPNLVDGAYYRNEKGELGRWRSMQMLFRCINTPTHRPADIFRPIFREHTELTRTELSALLHRAETENTQLYAAIHELSARHRELEDEQQKLETALGSTRPKDFDVRDLAWRTNEDGMSKMIKVQEMDNLRLRTIVTHLRQQITKVRLQTGTVSLSFLTLTVLEDELERRHKAQQSKTSS